MKSVFKYMTAAVCLLLAAALVLPLAGCASSKLGEPLLTLEDQTLTENMFRLLMSRVKGNFAAQGYNVSSPDLWDTIALSDGTLYDEYIRQIILTDAKTNLAAAVMFDEEKLTLPDDTVKAIDDEIDQMIEDAGSENALNAKLAEFGANADILRALYMIEAKYAALIGHLYGEDGSKIGDNVKQEYAEANAVCFRQLMLRSYAYVYEKDLNGDDIYYLSNENNGQVSNIAYDEINGIVRTDEFGRAIVDKNGDTVYFTSTGRIAYDTANGVRSFAYAADGSIQTKPLSSAEIAAHKDAAEEVLTKAVTGGPAAFEALLNEFAASGDDSVIADTGYCFLYTDGSNSGQALNDIADALADMQAGDARVLSTEYGYHVIMKYAMPSDAAVNSAYADWFEDLPARVIEQLFAAKCAPYVEKIEVNAEVWKALPSMKEIGTNYYY